MVRASLCAVRFRQSKRRAQELLSTLLNVDMSLCAISKIEQQASETLAAPVEEAQEHVRQQMLAGKSGGKKQRAWLWVVTASLVTVFRIAKSRARMSPERCWVPPSRASSELTAGAPTSTVRDPPGAPRSTIRTYAHNVFAK